MSGRLLRLGLGAGVGAGLLDVALIAAVDPAASEWMLAQSLLAWAGTGWAVVASESGLGSFAHGVLATVALNLGWLVALGPGAGTPEHVPPLVAMSVVFGAAFGWVHQRARRGRAATAPAHRPAAD